MSVLPDLRELARTLRRLDEVDRELFGIRGELLAGPRRVADLRGASEAATASLSAAEAVLAASRRKQREIERHVEETQRLRTRAQGRLPTLISSTQIEATQREIASLSADIAGSEDRQLEVMMVLDEQEAAKKSAAARSDSAAGALADAEAGLAAARPGLEARAAELEAARGTLEAGLIPDARRQYAIGLRSPSGPAAGGVPSGITHATKDVCDACKYRIPPKWVQEARTFLALHHCDGCKRVLVYDPDLPA
jgi:predicted  nucleic acid-binding Zn-ribbon protein